MARKHKTLADNLFALANVLQVTAQMGAGFLAWIERRRTTTRDALHEQGLALKNRLTAQKIATEQHRTATMSNNIVIGDQNIELNELKIRRERWSQKYLGIDNPGMNADNYPDPFEH